MAKLFVTEFTPLGPNNMRAVAFYQDQDTYLNLNIEGISFDPAIATSLRQQMIDTMVPRANQAVTDAGYPGKAIPIASDIEYVV